MTENTLIIAFDGLDHELIQKFNLKHVVQEEFGTIDNEAGMSSIITSELFASFITGKTYKQHGIKGLFYYDGGKKGQIIDKITDPKLVQNIRGFHRLRKILMAATGVKKRRYTKEDLHVDTIFEKIDGSRAMFIPGYNPDKFWEMKCEATPLEYGYDIETYLEFWDNRSYEHRKRMLFRELDLMARPLLMCHFHRTDTYQHMYGDKEIDSYDEEKLLKLYQETDQLAKEIKEKAQEIGYDRIIFMSDHGLPSNHGHNINAFYSSNKPLFPDKTPKITDFAGKLD